MESDLDGNSASRVQSSVAESGIPISSATLDDEFYPLDHDKKMGYCLIFNHKKYDFGASERKGTDIDTNALEEFFKKYKFEVKVYTDEKKEEISDIISEIATCKDLENTCCFVCCVLTHGALMDNKEVLCAKDEPYITANLLTPFLNCSALLNKPKLFFIQACRGEGITEGMDIVLQPNESSHLQNFGFRPPVLMCRLPKEADFLIAHSTVPGHAAWENPTNGSWFIQELCKALNENAGELDLESILTIVRRRVALHYPYEPKKIWLDEVNWQKTNLVHKMKQIPSTYSTLTRKFKFPTIN